MAFADFIGLVAFLHPGTRTDHTGIGSEAQRTALVNFIILSRHEVNHLIGGVFIEFPGVCPCKICHMSGKLDYGNLHTQAEAEIGDLMLSRKTGSEDLSFYSAASEPARDKDSVYVSEKLSAVLGFDRFGINPADGDFRAAGIARVFQRLDHG